MVPAFDEDHHRHSLNDDNAGCDGSVDDSLDRLAITCSSIGGAGTSTAKTASSAKEHSKQRKFAGLRDSLAMASARRRSKGFHIQRGLDDDNSDDDNDDEEEEERGAGDNGTANHSTSGTSNHVVMATTRRRRATRKERRAAIHSAALLHLLLHPLIPAAAPPGTTAGVGTIPALHLLLLHVRVAAPMETTLAVISTSLRRRSICRPLRSRPRQCQAPRMRMQSFAPVRDRSRDRSPGPDPGPGPGLFSAASAAICPPVAAVLPAVAGAEREARADMILRGRTMMAPSIP